MLNLHDLCSNFQWFDALMICIFVASIFVASELFSSLDYLRDKDDTRFNRDFIVMGAKCNVISMVLAVISLICFNVSTQIKYKNYIY